MCQGINTADFDTAEFEVVKSRLTLQKERKEQREQEERAAAQKAVAEAAAVRKAAHLAARKAVHEAAKEQIRAQRELNKAEAQASRSFSCCFVSCMTFAGRRHGRPRLLSSPASTGVALVVFPVCSAVSISFSPRSREPPGSDWQSR